MILGVVPECATFQNGECTFGESVYLMCTMARVQRNSGKKSICDDCGKDRPGLPCTRPYFQKQHCWDQVDGSSCVARSSESSDPTNAMFEDEENPSLGVIHWSGKSPNREIQKNLCVAEEFIRHEPCLRKEFMLWRLNNQTIQAVTDPLRVLQSEKTDNNRFWQNDCNRFIEFNRLQSISELYKVIVIVIGPKQGLFSVFFSYRTLRE